MIYELRHYQVKPGQQAAWAAFMDSEIIPFQVAHGMVICGSFTGENENDYIWLRRFTDDDERKRLYAAVYQSDHWKNVIGPRVPDMVDLEKIQVTRMTPTPKSVLQ